MFAHTPIKIQFAATHRSAIGKYFFDQRVHFEISWHGSDANSKSFQFGQRHRRIRRVGPLAIQERHPVNRVLALEIRDDRIDCVASGIHRIAVGLDQIVTSFGGNSALRN